MKLCLLVSAFCLLISVGFAGLSGTYTIRPDGSGDFASFHEACVVLGDSGLSGDVVFDAYTGDYSDGPIGLGSIAGNDSLSITFRAAEGEAPAMVNSYVECSAVKRVAICDIAFNGCYMAFDRCSGCRLSGCEVWGGDDGIVFSRCSGDTIDGNRIRQPYYAGIGIAVVECHDELVYNNAICAPPMEPDYMAPVVLSPGSGCRFYFNTVWCRPEDSWYAGALWIDGYVTGDARNNIFVIDGRNTDSLCECVGLEGGGFDSLALDYNCYFVRSVGSPGMIVDPESGSSYEFYDFPSWQGLGLEPHGFAGDPLLVDSMDLHLRQGSPCIGAGVPIPGFEFDIDGDPRDPVHPDIGADEFTGGGVEEGMKDEGGRMNNGPTILSGAKVHSLASKVVFDALGRRALNPTPGVYFVREQSVVSSQHSGTEHGARNTVHVRKVVIQK